MKQQLIPNRVQVIFVSRTWICLKDLDDEFVLKNWYLALCRCRLMSWFWGKLKISRRFSRWRSSWWRWWRGERRSQQSRKSFSHNLLRAEEYFCYFWAFVFKVLSPTSIYSHLPRFISYPNIPAGFWNRNSTFPHLHSLTKFSCPGNGDNTGWVDPDPGHDCLVPSMGEHLTQPTERNAKASEQIQIIIRKNPICKYICHLQLKQQK